MRRVTRASVAASENDKENQIPLLDINLNAKAAVRDQLNNVVRERTGKLTLKKTLDNAVKTKSNENAMGAVKWTAKYIVNGQPVVTKAPKINRRSNEQKTALNNISNKSLAAASGKDDKTEDVRNEDGQLDAVRPKGKRREANKFRQTKVHSHKKRKYIRIQKSCLQTEKVVAESSSEEDRVKGEHISEEEVINITDDAEVLSKSGAIPADCEQLIVSDQIHLKSRDSNTVLPGPLVSDQPHPVDSETDEEEDGDFAPMPHYLHDIDYEDDDDPNFMNEYVLDIYDYMRTLERESCLSVDFLSKQSEITDRMRSVLVDWLVLANYEYRMTQDTLFLTVAIIDRYLQKVNTPKNDLQLVGVAAMWVASKYEEISTVEVAELVRLTDDSYTAEQVRHMECDILKVLDFQLNFPLQIQFLRRFTKAAGGDPFLHAVAKYLMELTLVPYNLAHYPASKVAAAAVCLSNALIESTPDYRQFWNGTMVFHSKYEIDDLTEIIKELGIEALSAGQSRFTAVTKKFATSRLMRASTFLQKRLSILRQIASESSQ